MLERICFALVAQRALEPGSKLAATRWVAERVAIEGCPRFDADAACAAMDFLAAALPEIAEAIFASTANLLNLACDVIFVDTSLSPPSHPVGLIRPTDLQGSADAEDQRSEGEMPTA